METDIDVYFRDRKARGSADQTKTPTGFCDSTFPRGTDLAPHSQAQLNTVARQLNERPKKHWTPTRQQRDSTTVLPRPVETTAKNGIAPKPVFGNIA